MQIQGAGIADVVKGSLADQLGVTPGSVLLSVNGQPVTDIVDYRLALASEQVEISWRDTLGQTSKSMVDKEYGCDLGLVFDSPTIDQVKLCRNNCQFCFVRQLPAGLRDTLQVRDDDYRLSALQGSFVTLTNLSDAEWQRVLSLHLSPLYVSVHTTNGQLRTQMTQNPAAGQIMQRLQQLAEHRIEVHCQIVLVPGVNDGRELARTIEDLAGLWPAVQSVAVVPVGLTGHRAGLPKLRAATADDARRLIDYLLPRSRRFREQHDVSFAYLADEWFVLAGSSVPERGYYDDFPQIENGVGLIRKLVDQAARALRTASVSLERDRRVLWVTGYSALGTLTRLAERMNQIERLWVDVFPVRNRFFGESITVAGLVTGRDIIEQLRQVDTTNAVILIPDVMLRQMEQDFLDGVSFAELRSAFPQAEVVLIPTDGRSLVKQTLGEVCN